MQREFIEKTQEGIKKIYNLFVDKVDELGEPEVYFLNKKAVSRFTSAVAVDAGESLFFGAFKIIGITIFMLATSDPKDEPQYFFLYNGENLATEKSKEVILNQLSEWYETIEIVKDFLNATGWSNGIKNPKDIFPPRMFNDSSECISVFREILEWAKLYNLAKQINELKKNPILRNDNFVLLRDGVLRFNNMGEGHTNTLREIFKNLDIPIIGVTKRSKLLLNPLVQMWLRKYGILDKKESFVVKLNKDFFERAEWSLSRYYSGEIRFGNYHIVRFDSFPGNCNLFIVDIPDYIDNWDEILNILSGLKFYTSTTVFPVPGYPYPLIEAHRRAKLDEDKVKLIENSLKRNLSQEHYEMLKNLIDINMRRIPW